MSTFEEKVESLVEKLGEDIAALASDGDEYANGLAQAAVLLLEQGSLDEFGEDDRPNGVTGNADDVETFDPLLNDDDDEDEFDPFLEDEDDSLWDSGTEFEDELEDSDLVRDIDDDDDEFQPQP